MYTNEQLLSMYEKITQLLNKDVKFSAKVSFTILQNYRTILPIVEDVEKARMGIIEAFGEPIEDKPGMFRSKEGCGEEMARQLNELGSMENNIHFRNISIDDLQDADLTLADMDALYPMIDEGN